PFGVDRYGAFMAAVERSERFADLLAMPPRLATRAELEWFHTPTYIDRVIELSQRGSGLLDAGDTPAFPGVFEAASFVVGGTLAARPSARSSTCRCRPARTTTRSSLRGRRSRASSRPRNPS